MYSYNDQLALKRTRALQRLKIAIKSLGVAPTSFTGTHQLIKLTPASNKNMGLLPCSMPMADSGGSD
jgi:hypothetical protein